MMYGYVYKTTNTANGKLYIGLSRGSFDPAYKGSGKILKQAVEKYGLGAFSVEILEWCRTPDDLDAAEKRWIEESNATDDPNYYNIMPGGLGFRGKHSDESKKKIGDAQRGRKRSLDTRRRISEGNSGDRNGMHGYIHSPEQIEAMRKRMLGENNPFFGKKHSARAIETIRENSKKLVHTDESRRKISEGNRGRIQTQAEKDLRAEARRGKTGTLLTCPHCGLTANAGNVRRWHFDHCKSLRSEKIVPDSQPLLDGF